VALRPRHYTVTWDFATPAIAGIFEMIGLEFISSSGTVGCELIIQTGREGSWDVRRRNERVFHPM